MKKHKAIEICRQDTIARCEKLNLNDVDTNKVLEVVMALFEAAWNMWDGLGFNTAADIEEWNDNGFDELCKCAL